MSLSSKVAAAKEKLTKSEEKHAVRKNKLAEAAKKICCQQYENEKQKIIN